MIPPHFVILLADSKRRLPRAPILAPHQLLSERSLWLLIAKESATCATRNNRLSLIAKHVMPIVVCSKNMRSNTWQHGIALPPPTTQLCCVKSLSAPPFRALPINSCFLECIGPVRVPITFIDIHMRFYAVLLFNFHISVGLLNVD